MDNIDEFEKRLRRIKECLDAGSSYFKAGSWHGAESRFEEALLLIDENLGSDHPDAFTCVLQLGQVYYQLDKFDLARQSFIQVLSSTTCGALDPALRVSILLKMSKICARRNERQEEEDYCQSASECAQKELPEGHPLISTALDAHAQVLRRKDPHKAQLIEEQAKRTRDPQQRQALRTEALLDGLTPDDESRSAKRVAKSPGDSRRARDVRKLTIADASQRFVDRLRALSSDRRKIAVLAIVTIAVPCACVAAWYVNKVILVPPDPAVSDFGDRTFFSADNRKKISFRKNGKAIFDTPEGKFVGPYCLKQPLASENESQIARQKIVVNLDWSPGYLEDTDGTKLYESNAGELKLVEQMRLVARVASDHYARHGTFPLSMTYLKVENPDIVYSNPFTGLVEEPSMRAGTIGSSERAIRVTRPGGWREGGHLDSLYFRRYGNNGLIQTSSAPHISPDEKSALGFRDLVAGNYVFAVNEDPGLQGTIRCLLCVQGLNQEQQSFFIRGFDRNGHQLSGSASHKAFVIRLPAETAGKPSKSESVEAGFIIKKVY